MPDTRTEAPTPSFRSRTQPKDRPSSNERPRSPAEAGLPTCRVRRGFTPAAASREELSRHRGGDRRRVGTTAGSTTQLVAFLDECKGPPRVVAKIGSAQQ